MAGTMKRLRVHFIAEALFLVIAIVGSGRSAANNLQYRGGQSSEGAMQPRAEVAEDSPSSEMPSNVVTSKGPVPKSPTQSIPPSPTTRRNPDYDSSGNIILDLGAKINDMEVIENNIVIVSPADKGKMFFVNIEPGVGLKGVKVTSSFGYSPESSGISREIQHPCIVVFDKKRFGESEDTSKAVNER